MATSALSELVVLVFTSYLDIGVSFWKAESSALQIPNHLENRGQMINSSQNTANSNHGKYNVLESAIFF